jgi:signal transduction histidine kinase
MSYSQNTNDVPQPDPDEEIDSLKGMLVDAEKSAAFCQMLSGISHELNTPLGICITANSSLIHSSGIIQKAMKEETLTADQLISFLDEIKTITEVVESSLDRTKELVDSIKLVSSEQQTNKIEYFNLSKSLNSISQALRPQLKVRSIEFEIVCDAGLVINYKQGDIYSIVCNLIQNAIKHAYSENDSGKISLKCDYRDEQQILNLQFADYGRGMSEQERLNIFQPYYTTSKEKGGTGLGLAIIKEIVEKDEGDVSCTSGIGKGTQFNINIKCQRE